MSTYEANAEEMFQNLNIPECKVIAAKIAKDYPGTNRVSVFHGREGEAAYCLVLNVDATYSGPTDSMFHLNILHKAHKEPKQDINDWAFFVERGDEIPEEFIITDYRCVLYEKPGRGNISEKRLNGKQEIADFLGLSIDTLDQLRKEGLPVNNPPEGRRKVYAYPTELNKWMDNHRKPRKESYNHSRLIPRETTRKRKKEK
jgi:hypothetical protein